MQPLIIDNVLDESLFDLVYDQIMDPSTPWYHGRTAYAGGIGTDDQWSWSHLVLTTTTKSSLFDLLYMAILDAVAKTGQTIKSLYRIRLGLQTKTDFQQINAPHTDAQYPHLTGLIYLQDSAASTVLYNEKYDIDYQPKTDRAGYEYYTDVLNRNVTILQEIESVRNRMVCFDGLTYHSSTTPVDVNARVTINFNYTIV
jgi:hypothetical protein